ncbi:MAG: DUF962 domain-containing protein [Deltaproteobacteria bacterium]|nr:DUF962 domain-containing protein [Deltaproteobacteria bacterium]
MKSLVDQLANYAKYHRDKRNIATHFVGVPMIVVGSQALLARIGIGPFNAAVGVTAAAGLYYRKLDPKYGSVMAGLLGGSCAVASVIAAMPLPIWAGTALGLFVGGWAIQLVGHKFEGQKPAFLDDLMGLLIGPLYIVAETAFALGMSPEIRDEIERRVGPTHWGTAPEPAFAAAAAA